MKGKYIDIRNYWDERAKNNFLSPTATTNDIYLRELEVISIVEKLKELKITSGYFIDIGCGDGLTTIKIASNFPKIRILGIDYSENMIRIAREYLKDYPEISGRVNFEVMDIFELDKKYKGVFDVSLTVRCLINLPSFQLQKKAIKVISSITSKVAIMIENFLDGHNEMNKARKKFGLEPIPIRWHNKFFETDKFVREASKFFSSLEINNFASSYYLATKVLYSAICKSHGVEPDYSHDIHKFAVNLPPAGNFGPTKMVVMKK